MIYWHRHHMIPRHAGGTDDTSNLVRVNLPMHAMLHKIRWEEIGDEYDKIAWLTLSGQIGKEEASNKARRAASRLVFEKRIGIFGMTPEKKDEANRKGGKKGGRATANRGVGFFAMTPDEKFKARSKGGKKNKAILQRVTCPHCGKETNIGNAKRWHFDNCKHRKGP